MEGPKVNIVRCCMFVCTVAVTIAVSTDGLAQHGRQTSRAARRPVRSSGAVAVSEPQAVRARVATDPQYAEMLLEEEPAIEEYLLDDEPTDLSIPLAESTFSHDQCTPNSVCYPLLADGWLDVEYLMWWPRPMDIPPLVTQGTTTSLGVLNQPGTVVLLGDQMLNQMYSGARLRLGFWTSPCRDYAWEVDGFFIGEASDHYSVTGWGAAANSVLARPFFNVQQTVTEPPGIEDAELITYPGELSGRMDVEATSQLYGIGVHGIKTFSRSCGCGPAVLSLRPTQTERQISGFLGWRYLNFAEDLHISENLTSLLPAPDDGEFHIEDRFETDNTFNGMDIGLMWNGRRGPFSLELIMRVALGSNHQNVSINGTTSISGSSDTGNDFENAPGGLLAQRTNIGSYSRNQFAVVPELGVKIGCPLSAEWQVSVGYTFLYWSGVVRPGDQIDRHVNPGLFPPESQPLTGLERPVFGFVNSDLWVNGLNVGLVRTW